MGYNKPMIPQRIKTVLSLVVLAAAILGTFWYLSGHPKVVNQLAGLSPLTVVLLVILYAVFTGGVAAILYVSVRLCNSRLSAGESTLVTSYSAVINFFGPLQSGPVFRAVYLKTKHGVSLRKYTAATTGYYAVYGICSLLFLLAPLLGRWLAVIVAALAVKLYILGRVNWKYRQIFSSEGLKLLIVATLAQVVVMVVIYAVELQAVGQHPTLPQLLSYTGAANLALFVSLTPGAIGFREAFLYFSGSLHGIPASSIIAANLVDRAVYVTWLIIIIFTLSVTQTGRELSAMRKKT